MKNKRKIIIGILVIVCCLFLLANGQNDVKSRKLDIPESEYTKVGYGIKAEQIENLTKITYAVVGLSKDRIAYAYIDQIEKDLSEDDSRSTNKEMKNAYGLAYTSDCGEWYQQVQALENYIVGNKMTIQDVKNIPTYEMNEKNKSVPKKGSDLAVACELNIEDFIEVIDEACRNAKNISATNVAIGESFRISNEYRTLYLTTAVLAMDYDSKISYVDFCELTVNELGLNEVVETKDDIDELENYIVGKTLQDSINIEVYDPGNGIATALPKPGSKLAQSCNVDLEYLIYCLQEIEERV